MVAAANSRNQAALDNFILQNPINLSSQGLTRQDNINMFNASQQNWVNQNNANRAASERIAALNANASIQAEGIRSNALVQAEGIRGKSAENVAATNAKASMYGADAAARGQIGAAQANARGVIEAQRLASRAQVESATITSNANKEIAGIQAGASRYDSLTRLQGVQDTNKSNIQIAKLQQDGNRDVANIQGLWNVRGQQIQADAARYGADRRFQGEIVNSADQLAAARNNASASERVAMFQKAGSDYAAETTRSKDMFSAAQQFASNLASVGAQDLNTKLQYGTMLANNNNDNRTRMASDVIAAAVALADQAARKEMTQIDANSRVDAAYAANAGSGSNNAGLSALANVYANSRGNTQFNYSYGGDYA